MAETISRRMKQARHPYQVIADTDIDRVSRLFEEAFEASILKNKLILDTTTARVAETLSAFVTKMQPFLTDADRRRWAT